MKTTMETVKLRAFLVRFVPCTNYKPSRCVIEDLNGLDWAQSYPEDRQRFRVMMSKADEFDGCANQALAYLEGRGIKIEHVAAHPNGTLLLSRDCRTELREEVKSMESPAVLEKRAKLRGDLEQAL